MAGDIEAISQHDVTALVDAGRAHRHRVAAAVLLDGRWWAIHASEEEFRPVAPEFAAELARMQELMAAADQTVARARSGARSP